MAATAVLALLAGCMARTHATPAVPELRATVLAELPHDSTAYSEGLELDGAVLWEATGKAGQSQLRQLDPANGAVRSFPPGSGAASRASLSSTTGSGR